MFGRMSRRIALSLLLVPILPVLVLATQPSLSVLSPTIVKFQKPGVKLGDVTQQLSSASRIPILVPPSEVSTPCPVNFTGTPFWQALEQTATKTKTKIVLTDKGTKVVLEPLGACREVSTVSGPFRVVTKQVIGRALLDLGVTFYEVNLEVHWEPRIPVYRIDSIPRITRAIDDRGTVLTVPGGSSNAYPTEALTDMKVRVDGLARASKEIAVLAGEFRVTAAQKLVSFTFEKLAEKLPRTQLEEKVAATLKRVAKVDKFWEIDLELLYPDGHPAFESFEEQKWLRDNKLQLLSPDRKPHEPGGEELSVGGRRVLATYRFADNLTPLAKGWSLVYEAPSPLVEVKVPFELKNLPLP